MRFKEFIEQNTIGYHNDGPGSGFSPTGGSYLSSDWSGSEASDTMQLSGHPPHLPGLDLQLPTVKKTSKINILEKNKNPIYIQLEDGTKLYFTWDEFKKIKGKKPERGDIMSVTFQRLPHDNSKEVSQIQSVEVH